MNATLLAFAIFIAVLVFLYYRQGTGGASLSKSDLSLIDLSEAARANLFWLAAGLFVLGLAVIFGGVAWDIRRADFFIQGPARYAWDEHGIHQHTQHASLLYHWESIDRWYESDRLFAAGISSQMGIMLPKAALTPEQITEIRLLLRDKLGDPKAGFTDAD